MAMLCVLVALRGRAAAQGAERDTMGDYYPHGEYLAGPGYFKTKGCGRG